jgi:hypothetical protein
MSSKSGVPAESLLEWNVPLIGDLPSELTDATVRCWTFQSCAIVNMFKGPASGPAVRDRPQFADQRCECGLAIQKPGFLARSVLHVESAARSACRDPNNTRDPS